MKCGILYALQRLAGHAPFDDGQRINFDMTAADEGSLGHIFQAHHHARFGAEDPAGVLVGVDDPGGKVWPAPVVHVKNSDDLLDPFEAARAWCKKTEKWALLPKMEACFKDYVQRYPEPDGRVHGVEWPVTLVLGEHPTRGWGLWLATGPEVVDGPIPATGWVHAVDGAEIDTDVLDMPGHPRHGEPIIVTRRIDAVIEKHGRYYIIDHKCVPLDTIVVDRERGAVPLSEIVRAGLPWQTLAFDERSGEVSWAAASIPWTAGNRDVYTVTLRNGMELHYGSDHPVLTKERGWVETSKLAQADAIAVVLDRDDAAEADISDALLRAIGTITADGSLTENGIFVVKKNRLVIASYVQALNDLGLAQDAPRKGKVSAADGRARFIIRAHHDGTTHVDVGKNSMLVALLHGLRMSWAHGPEKQLPSIIDRLSRRQVGILLGALWDGDGAAYLSRDNASGRDRVALRFVVRSHCLARQVHHLLLQLGICASLTASSVAYKGERRPTFCVGIVGRGRREFLMQVLDGRISAPATCAGGNISRRGASTPSAQALLDVLSAAREQQTTDVDGALWWVPVKQLSLRGCEPVYHVSVPGRENFVADGAVTHNCLANPSPSAARQEYRIDFGFSLFRMMGMQLWPGRFGDDGNGKNGVVVNLIKKEPTYRVIQEPVPPAPEVMRRLPRRILDAEYQLASLEMDVLEGIRTIDEFPGPSDETVCKGRYGMCHAAREEKSGGIPVCLFGREVCGVR